jgi:hypothetical protein
MNDAKKRGSFRTFTLADVKPHDCNVASCQAGHITCRREDLTYDPPPWMAAGRQQTATGYGAKLNSGYMIYFQKIHRRVYVTCFSNVGTLWFMYRGKKIILTVHS